MKLVLPRAAHDAFASKLRLQALGHEVVLAPAFIFHALDYTLPEGMDAAFATSANALRALRSKDVRHLAALPLYVSGDKTLLLAQELGFAKAQKLADTASELAKAIVSVTNNLQRAVYLAGRDRSLEVQLFAPEGVGALVETYAMQAATCFAAKVEATLKAEGELGVLLYSKRMAQVFCGLFAALDSAASPHFFCLSNAVAEEVSAVMPQASCTVCSAPNEESLFASIAG